MGSPSTTNPFSEEQLSPFTAPSWHSALFCLAGCRNTASPTRTGSAPTTGTATTQCSDCRPAAREGADPCRRPQSWSSEDQTEQNTKSRPIPTSSTHPAPRSCSAAGSSAYLQQAGCEKSIVKSCISHMQLQEPPKLGQKVSSELFYYLPKALIWVFFCTVGD